MRESTDLLNLLPEALEKCGQDSIAKSYREDLPSKCIDHLGKFSLLVVEFLNAPSQAEWLLINFFDLVKQYYNVKDSCPIF